MSARVPGDFMPSVKQAGVGWPYNALLMYSGTGLTAPANNLDSIVIPKSLSRDRRSIAASLADVQASVLGAGSGASGGSWTFTISRGGIAIATISVPYNSLIGADVDVRDTSQNGVALYHGDVLTLNLTAVPTGVLVGGLTVAKVQISATSYGLRAG